MSANRTYGDELADVFTSFAVEKNPTGLSVGIDSAYELGDYIESDWLVEHDRQVAERAWDEAAQAPTGDEREELIGLQLASYSKRMSDGYTSSIIRSNEEAAEIVLDAGFRLPVQGEPTDAQVLAALNNYEAWSAEETLDMWGTDQVARMRAALRAAGVTAVQGGQVVPCARCGENLVVAAARRLDRDRPQHRDLEELLMSTDYEPTTEQVRSHYVFDQGDVWRRERGEAFDRWLAAHDLEVAAKALEDAAEDFRVREEQQKRAEAERAWDEAIQHQWAHRPIGNRSPHNPHRKGAS